MILASKWKSWLSYLKCNRLVKRAPAASARPQVEHLEDRLTPAVLDLTTHGAIGMLNDGIFRQFDAQPTGTGVINSFVRIQSTKGAVQQGYNSDHRPVQFDENTSPQFTRSLSLDSVPIVDIDGVQYREFLLDINQKASQPLLSLDELRLYVGNAPDLTGYDVNTHQLAGMNAIYDLDGGGDNWIKLDARLNQGSGKGDMLAYIPNAAFTAAGGSYVYLYSKFGVNNAPNAGFEEWAAGKAALTSATGSISGSVFQQNSTSVMADVVVFLDANHDGLLDNNEVFTITDVNGYYQFNFLATDLGAYSTYQVTIETSTLPPHYGLTAGELPYIDVSLQTDGQTATGTDFFVVYSNPVQPPGPPRS